MKTSNHMTFHQIADLMLDAICVVDTRGRFVFVSAASERIFGYTPAEMIGKAMINMVFPEDREKTMRAVDDIMAGNSKQHFKNRYLRKDGSVVHIMWSAHWSESDHLRVAVARDITAYKQAETLQTALYSISEAAHTTENLLYLLKQIHQIISGLLPASNFFIALYNKENDELSFPYYVDEYSQTPTPVTLDSETLISNVIRSQQALLQSPADAGSAQSIGPQCWLGVPLISHQNTIGALVVQSYTTDICYTEEDKKLLGTLSSSVATAIKHKQVHERLLYTAQYDPLTRLPNRVLLFDRLSTGLAKARREQSMLALFYLDLDKFKQVNDNFGHASGDQLLQIVAQRLNQCLRETDTIARIGGDEFVVLLEKVNSLEDVNLTAEKIRATLNHPFELSNHTVHVLPSIGIALFPQHGNKADQLIRHADTAMYYAKRNGGNQFQIH